MAEKILNRRIVMASRPAGMPTPENFRLEEVEEPREAPEGGVLLRTLFFSLDPYMRGRMDAGPSYAQALEPGGVMEGGSVCEVIASRDPGFQPGDIVLAGTGWQTHPRASAKGLRKIDPSPGAGVDGTRHSRHAGYDGLYRASQHRHAEAGRDAGGGGGERGRGLRRGANRGIKGCRVVGIAGGEEKTRYIRDELGFDVALDHRAADFGAQLKAACPQGIDIYFENVGGEVWDLVRPLLNNFARVPVCGLIAQYNGVAGGGPGSSVALRSVLVKRLRIQGFIVSDFASQREDFLRDMAAWVASGQVKYREDVVEGIDKAVPAFIGLLQGRNFGKLLIRP